MTLGLAKLERMDQDQVALAVSVERRLVRIEAKLDWLVGRRERTPALVQEK